MPVMVFAVKIVDHATIGRFKRFGTKTYPMYSDFGNFSFLLTLHPVSYSLLIGILSEDPAYGSVV